ncbi:MAG: DNA repair protein RecN [Prevotella sp.]|nr:DNA repair protein RecN [Candidatus Equicola faecalis]
MIKELSIRNYTLIEELDITFHAGFSVITGETGAGKSIIIGAVGLLLGQRADAKAIKEGKEKCVVEAHFAFEDDTKRSFFEANDIEYDAGDCIIRREVNISGKSRAFINDTPVPLSLLKEIGTSLMDIHSQHQNLLLNDEDFQIDVTDIIAQDAKALEEYRQQYDILCQERRNLDRLEQTINSTNADIDYLRYQCEELSAAALKEGEQEELEEEASQMSHAEEIKTALYNADSILQGEDGEGSILSSLSDVYSHLSSISNVLASAQELSQRCESALIEMQDVSHEISSLLDNISFDADRMEYINQRLDLIYSLEKKYKCDDIDALNALLTDIQTRLSALEISDLDLENARRKVAQAQTEAEKKAEDISSMRMKAARAIEEEMHTRLIQLGMPNVRFKVEIEDETDATHPGHVILGKKGKDRVTFMLSANKNISLQPVSQIASGGETARVMLSLKAMIGGATKLPTIIFDEIDTGVSGAIAEKMGEIMAEMGNGGRQVISITHLPQIAAQGTHQYKVYKDDTLFTTCTHMRELTTKERITEIAQMLSGATITSEAISNARSLLKGCSINSPQKNN